MENVKVKTKLAISAFVDLLGFSDHMRLANYDTRTPVGEIAVNRLLSLEEHKKSIEKEMEQYPAAYPDKKFKMLRFNDAVFLTMELEEFLRVEVGEHLWTGFSYATISDYLKEKGKESTVERKQEFPPAGARILSCTSGGGQIFDM